MRRLLSLGLDIYCYTTFTTPTNQHIGDKMARFVDKLQILDPNLPLRTVPLEIKIYRPMQERLCRLSSEALSNQYCAVDAWVEELSDRYTKEELATSITEVALQGRRR